MPSHGSKKDLHSIFSHRTDRVILLLQKMKKDTGQEVVHDARVAIRRFLVAFDIIKLNGRESHQSNLKSKLKKVFRRLGKIRDLQLQTQARRSMSSLFPVDASQLDALSKRQKKQIQKLSLDLDCSLESILNMLSNVKVEVLKLSETSLVESVQVQLEKTKSIWMKKREKASKNLVGEYHSLRIALKKFRYVFEIVSEISHSAADKSTLEALRNEQDVLGRFHDLEIYLQQTAAEDLS